jgi:membrane protease YdiL (CAAX protease family)
MNPAKRLDWIVWGVAIVFPAVCCWSIHLYGGGRGTELGDWWHDGSAFVRLIVVYPLVEELAFRGVVQGALLRWTHRRELAPALSLANAITSLLFVAIHCVYHPPVWAAAVLIPSVIFGYARERFGGVTVAVILHAYYNGLFYTTMGH